ncbi:unnamed protein product [Caenorhabditis sp. 36 PRJEB53466]|nr:unnamed protein product [Caenorhabditis sp. 36 PRJEB53466]
MTKQCEKGRDSETTEKGRDEKGRDGETTEKGRDEKGRDGETTEKGRDEKGRDGETTETRRDETGRDGETTEKGRDEKGRDGETTEKGRDEKGRDSETTEKGRDEKGRDGETTEKGRDEKGRDGETTEKGRDEKGRDSETTEKGRDEKGRDGETTEKGRDEKGRDGETTEKGRDEKGRDGETTEKGRDEKGRDGETTEKGRDEKGRDSETTEKGRDEKGRDGETTEKGRDEKGRDGETTEKGRDEKGRDGETTEKGRDEKGRDGETTEKGRDEKGRDGETTEKGRDEKGRDGETTEKGRDEKGRDSETTEKGRDEKGRDSETTEKGRDEKGRDGETTEKGRDEKGRDRDRTETRRDEKGRDGETTEKGRDGETTEKGRDEKGRDRDRTETRRDEKGRDGETTETRRDETGRDRDRTEKGRDRDDNGTRRDRDEKKPRRHKGETPRFFKNFSPRRHTSKIGEGQSLFISPANKSQVLISTVTNSSSFFVSWQYVDVTQFTRVLQSTGSVMSLALASNSYYTFKSTNDQVVLHPANVKRNFDLVLSQIYVYDGEDLKTGKFLGNFITAMSETPYLSSSGKSLTIVNFYGTASNSYVLANDLSTVSGYASYGFYLLTTANVDWFEHHVDASAAKTLAFTYFCVDCNENYVANLGFVNRQIDGQTVQFQPLTPTHKMTKMLSYDAQDQVWLSLPQQVPSNLFTMTVSNVEVTVELASGPLATWNFPYAGRRGWMFSPSVWDPSVAAAYTTNISSAATYTFNFNLQSIRITDAGKKIRIEVGAPNANPAAVEFGQSAENVGARAANGTYMATTFDEISPDSNFVLSFQIDSPVPISTTLPTTTTPNSIQTTTKASCGISRLLLPIFVILICFMN